MERGCGEIEQLIKGRDIVLATVRCCVHLEERLLWQAVFSYAWHVTHGTRQRQRHYSLHTYFFVYVQLATTSDKSPASCRPRHVVSGGATFAKLHDIVTSFTLNIGLCLYWCREWNLHRSFCFWLVCNLNRTPTVLAKRGGSCVYFQESQLAGEPPERLFHIHSVHRYQLCTKYLYASTLL